MRPASATTARLGAAARCCSLLEQAEVDAAAASMLHRDATGDATPRSASPRLLVAHAARVSSRQAKAGPSPLVADGFAEGGDALEMPGRGLAAAVGGVALPRAAGGPWAGRSRRGGKPEPHAGISGRSARRHAATGRRTAAARPLSAYIRVRAHCLLPPSPHTCTERHPPCQRSSPGGRSEISRHIVSTQACSMPPWCSCNEQAEARVARAQPRTIAYRSHSLPWARTLSRPRLVPGACEPVAKRPRPRAPAPRGLVCFVPRCRPILLGR